MTEVRSTLAERGATYGRFDHHATLARRIIEVVSSGENFSSMPPDAQHALCYIADKMARVLTGQHDHRDSWLDMAGYATLIVDRIDGTGAYAAGRDLGDVHAPGAIIRTNTRNPR